jgi:predicted TIM-barrel fold metal-dependent hydrolase
VEIVDAQLHPGLLGPRWREATADELVDVSITAMDAVGIDAVLLDEWVGWTGEGGIIPGHDSAGGVRRANYPVAERAVARFPRRFAYTARIEPNDPELPALMAELRSHPGRVALRWFAPLGETESFAHQAWEDYFTLTQRHELAIFLLLPGKTTLLEPYVRRFPDQWFVIDHCGVDFPRVGEATARRFDDLDDVIALARYPNVALKWCHAPRLSVEPFPFRDVLAQFPRVLEAFGPERVMWAADHLQAHTAGASFRRVTWAESLYYLLHSDALSESEREWVFGKTVRTILRWPP